MNWFKRLFFRITTISQFKIKFDGNSFIGHLIASFFLSVLSTGILLLVSGSIFFCATLFMLFPQDFHFLLGAAWLLVMRFTMLAVPMFLITRLVLVFKKEGLISFLGALVEELIVIVPFLGFLAFGLMMWLTF